MKCVLRLLLAVGTIVLFDACASSDDTMTGQAGPQSTATVPGEKIPGDAGSAAPVPGGAGANFHW